MSRAPQRTQKQPEPEPEHLEMSASLTEQERAVYPFDLYELWTHPDGLMTAGDAVFFN